ncbi:MULTISPECIES: hypothetical protein [unclassified Actinotalea]|uniref:hypothetical protein n=1 Tax=unclassified Actinotalea TaxID=2638618 RepID=UPI0015F70B29|nr:MULTISPECIES: hypothetical protein [unclassified Actinotalea]
MKLLTLTPAGRDLRGRIADSIAEHSMVLARLGEEQRDALVPMLDALLAGEAPPARPA